MMYEVGHKEMYEQELQEAIDAQTRNSTFIKSAMSIEGLDFDKDVINKLWNCRTWPFLRNHIKSLKNNGLIGHDDYSLVIF